MYTEPVKKIIAGCVFYAPLAIMPIYISYFYKNVSSDFVSFCIVLYCFVSFFAPIYCFSIILFYAHLVIFFVFLLQITPNKSASLRNTSYFHTCFTLANHSKITVFCPCFRIDSDSRSKTPPAAFSQAGLNSNRLFKCTTTRIRIYPFTVFHA